MAPALHPLKTAMALKPLKAFALLSGTALLASLPLMAATRLTTYVNGAQSFVEWPASSFPIRYSVDQRLLDIIGGPASLDRALSAWSSTPNANISFRSEGIGQGLKAGRDGKTVITVSDDLFRDQKAIALTTTWDERGVVTEADIQIDATLVNSGYNLQQAVTHEVGHLLGLDHSGVLSAAMYPYVGRGSEPPQLDSDDRIAIANMYPKADPMAVGGAFQGRVLGDQGGIYAAQVVAVNEAGEPVATTLTDAAGEFSLRGIPDGTYRLYAEPLDGPVDTRNLSPIWRQPSSAAFQTNFLDGAPLQIQSGRVYGNLVVHSSSAPVQLNLKWIGVSPASKSDFNLTSTAANVKAGDTIALAVAGDGIVSGMTTFEVLNPGIRRVSNFNYAGNYVYATFEVASTAPSGSVVIVASTGNENATLTGALRVVGGIAPSAEPVGRTRIARR
jgi:hypothetical protein